MARLMKWIIIAAATILVVLIAMYLGQDGVAPPMEQDGWWGRGPKQVEEDTSVRPFTINVSDDVILDLKTRLANTRFGDDLENTDFNYGFQSTYLKEVVRYWEKEYDWKKYEKELNRYPHFRTTIEGIEVHFLHVKPASTIGRPILITHGWPGSVWNFYKLIPRLTDPGKYGGRDEDAFEVICPSIPGFGFSEAPHQQGFDASDAARIFSKLMSRLGHRKYYLQGGDWGATISTIFSQAYPESVLGIHLNSFPNQDPKATIKEFVADLFPSLFLHPEEKEMWMPLTERLKLMLVETGYLHIQATKPDTVAAGLTGSPAGLAAYMLEKYSTGTNIAYRDLPDGGLTKKFTLDELLTNVMIYWVQGCGSSMRFYKESLTSEDVMLYVSAPVTVPIGLAAFPNEVPWVPEALVSSRFKNIVHYTRMPRGGHHAALEEPELLANDIHRFVKKVEHEIK